MGNFLSTAASFISWPSFNDATMKMHSTTCEITGAWQARLLDRLARRICRIFRNLFDYDIQVWKSCSGLLRTRYYGKGHPYPGQKDSRCYDNRIRKAHCKTWPDGSWRICGRQEGKGPGQFQEPWWISAGEFGVGPFYGSIKRSASSAKEDPARAGLCCCINVEHIF